MSSCVYQWLDMKKPSIDVHARLHPPVSVDGLASECNLFDVSSIKGVLVAGGNDGELKVCTLSARTQSMLT